MDTEATRLVHYGELSRAQEEIERGHVALAVDIVQRHIRAAGVDATADAHQTLGIALRLRGDQEDPSFYGEALDAFRTAETLACDDIIRRAQILRDRAMVSFSQENYVEAKKDLRASSMYLRPIGKRRLSWLARQFFETLAPFAPACDTRLDEHAGKLRNTEEQRIHIEYFVTEGFIARLLSRGDFRDRRRARRKFRIANRELWHHKPYARNNLIWDFKIEPVWYRLFWAPRLLYLVIPTGNAKRLVQAALLIISPYVAKRIEAQIRSRRPT